MSCAATPVATRDEVSSVTWKAGGNGVVSALATSLSSATEISTREECWNVRWRRESARREKRERERAEEAGAAVLPMGVHTFWTRRTRTDYVFLFGRGWRLTPARGPTAQTRNLCGPVLSKRCAPR
jgi:hypothetical protein